MSIVTGGNRSEQWYVAGRSKWRYRADHGTYWMECDYLSHEALQCTVCCKFRFYGLLRAALKGVTLKIMGVSSMQLVLLL